jgi:hypothetical protein
VTADVWLVACQDGDGDGVLVAERLRELGLEPVELIVATQLVHGAVWEHRVGGWGARTRLRLADGREIDSDGVRGMLNRLLWITADGFLGASETDREYAGGELHAVVQSWLESLGARVVNRPSGLGLSGPWRTPDQWRALAREHGLEIRLFPEPSEAPVNVEQVLVVDGEIVEHGDAPAHVLERARHMARALDHDLLELRFDDEWRFSDATLMPALAYRSDERVQAVADALEARAAA